MDGASKFVRGDAIAGLMITGVNIVGGIIIGIAQHGNDFISATRPITAADGRRRPRHADSGTHRVDRRRPHGVEGVIEAVRPTRRCSPNCRAIRRRSAWCRRDRGIVARCRACRCSLPRSRRRYRLGAWTAHVQNASAQNAPPKRPNAGARAERRADHSARDRPVPARARLCAAAADQRRRSSRLTDQIKALRRQLARIWALSCRRCAFRTICSCRQHLCIRIKEIEAGRGELFPGSCW